MMYLVIYLIPGLALYLYCLAIDAKTGFQGFKDADKMSIFRGILGAIFWPITAYILWSYR